MEQQILTGMVREQAALAVQLLEVGDTQFAKQQFQECVAKIEMIEAVTPNHKPATAKQITIES